ncbi:hypothetical protein PI124_g7041 [Phytophthora idaei]|nr:hypothetical protein PI125_g7174 [Phytophthora idaei]KAG3161643.1 hypothetical protein PI126_g6355 [Phytophthora idaei]KAG3248273.1 hypothetical protein PI124_g7041 [Phytophthora idaei]
MESSAQDQASSITLVKPNDPTTILKEQKQREPQSQPKPTKKRHISQQSMVFMHC